MCTSVSVQVIVLYCHLQIHIYIYTQHHNDTINKQTSEDFFINICNVWKGYSRFACERVLETEQKLQYFDLHSYGRQRWVFLVLQMLNRRPWGPLCWVLAFFTASYQQLLWSPNSIGVPEGPLGRCSFPYNISSITPTPTVTGTAT